MSNFKIKPLYDKVIIKPTKTEEKTSELSMSKAGLYIPKPASDQLHAEGIVVAAGTGRFISHERPLVPLHIKVGDPVLYKTFNATKITVSEEEYVIISESDIIGIIE